MYPMKKAHILRHVYTYLRHPFCRSIYNHMESSGSMWSDVV